MRGCSRAAPGLGLGWAAGRCCPRASLRRCAAFRWGRWYRWWWWWRRCFCCCCHCCGCCGGTDPRHPASRRLRRSWAATVHVSIIDSRQRYWPQSPARRLRRSWAGRPRPRGVTAGSRSRRRPASARVGTAVALCSHSALHSLPLPCAATALHCLRLWRG